MTSRVPVFVCGDPARGDDGAGFAALELLPEAARARADVVPGGQLDLLLLLDLPSDAPCVVVDAVAGLAPGEVWVRPLVALVDRAQALVASGRAPEPRSSHELPLEQVLALAAALRDAPPAGTFVGIGGSRWDVGATLSGPVAAALPAFAAAIATAIESLAAAGPEGDPPLAGGGRRMTGGGPFPVGGGPAAGDGGPTAGDGGPVNPTAGRPR
jgi:hydrogenase maturation protease